MLIITGYRISRAGQPLFAQRILPSGFICCGEKVM
jgi:hypothetical protein